MLIVKRICEIYSLLFNEFTLKSVDLDQSYSTKFYSLDKTSIRPKPLTLSPTTLPKQPALGSTKSETGPTVNAHVMN